MQFEVPQGVNQQEIENAISKKYPDSKFDWRRDSKRLILVIDSNDGVRQEIKEIIDLITAAMGSKKEAPAEIKKSDAEEQINFNEIFGKFAQKITAEASRAALEISKKSEEIVLQAKKDIEDEGVEQILKVEKIGESLKSEFSVLKNSLEDVQREIKTIATSIQKMGDCAKSLEIELAKKE